MSIGYHVYVDEGKFLFNNDMSEQFVNSIKDASKYFYSDAKKLADKYNGIVLSVKNN